MLIHFYKYHGAGNDFIIIDNRNNSFNKNNNILISGLSSRHFGIGADGLMLMEENKDYDFEMIYFNSDGKKGSMCGNGGRCIISFARKMGIIAGTAKFTSNGEIYSGTISGNRVKLQLQDVHDIEEFYDINIHGFIINTGSPHLVIFADDVENINVVDEGRKLRFHDRFKNEGINVDFVKILNKDNIFVRTYERGVEDETLSCGTGVVASAIATDFSKDQKSSPYSIRTKGGNLKVYFQKSGIYKNIILEGEADFVFEGQIDIT